MLSSASSHAFGLSTRLSASLIEISNARVQALAWRPDGSRVFANAGGTPVAIDTRTGREVSRRTGFPRVVGVEFTSSDVFLVRTGNGYFRCDPGRGGRGVQLSEARATSTAVSPNGREITKNQGRPASPRSLRNHSPVDSRPLWSSI